MEFTSDKISKIGKEIGDTVNGKVLFDDFSRGRYSTDASVYQIKPIGVVLPKDTNDVLKIMEYSQQNSIPLLARGGGSSQCGQTVGESIVLDYSKHQNKILELNVEEKYVWVEPGVVLDHLNAYLKPHGVLNMHLNDLTPHLVQPTHTFPQHLILKFCFDVLNNLKQCFHQLFDRIANFHLLLLIKV